MADSPAWKEGRVVTRTIPIGDDAEIVQILARYDNDWAVDSTIVREEDPGDTRSGRAVGLREAKKLADQHVDELRKTWASENEAEW